MVRVAQDFHPKETVPLQPQPLPINLSEQPSIPINLQPAEDPSIPIQEFVKIKEPIKPIIVQTFSQYKCINDYFDKIYCINLDRRTDRFENSSIEFSKNSLIVERFSAIDGNNLQETLTLNKWERACFMSHIEILKRIIEYGYERVLILEDDIEFIDNLQYYFIGNIKSIPDNWGMLYLGGNHINPPTPINNIIGRISRTYTTSSYAITKKTAEYMIKKLEKAGMKEQIDVFYSGCHRSGNCYTYYPKIAWQKPGFSDIQQGMQDYTGIIK